MRVTELPLSGSFFLQPDLHQDSRGHFVKSFQASFFKSYGLRTDFAEQYHSYSNKNVIRGMHFQLPPHEHVKLVYCVSGSVTDVILDLRKNSPTYGNFFKIALTSDSAQALYIPSGIAHGFAAIGEPAFMVYNVTSEYAPHHDAGIHWNSFGYNWGLESPAISERDQKLMSFESFISPF